MEPLRGTNLGVAEIDFKPQEGTSEKRTFRQHFNQLNEAKDKMTALNTFHTRRLFFKSPKSTALYANVKISSVAP